MPTVTPFYQQVLRPLMFRLEAEQAHHLGMSLLTLAGASPTALAVLRECAGANERPAAAAAGDPAADPRLCRHVFGRRFPNPVGLAAGFDKDGVALLAWEALGFGFVEVGTVTPQPQPGNPAPRLFRLPAQRGLVNRLGFNNQGADALARRLGALHARGRWPRQLVVGVNLGKGRSTPLEQAADDYCAGLARLYPYADYFVLNVSSPNTAGLRELQERGHLDGLLAAVQARNRALAVAGDSGREENGGDGSDGRGGREGAGEGEGNAGTAGAALRRPLLVKIAPDLSFGQIEEILDLAQRHGLAGVVATNTTVDRAGLPAGVGRETGGLSGEPLRRRATEVVRFVAARSPLPVIAAGGVSDADSAREKLDAGAVLVQLYTGLVYAGPALVREICRGLATGQPSAPAAA